MKLFLVLVAVIFFISHAKCMNNETDNNSLRLQDLNDDVILETFDRLELNELVDLADMNTRFRELITWYYIVRRYHFNEHLVKITTFNYNAKKMIMKDDGSLDIIGRELALKFLRIFGNSVSHIRFSHSYSNHIDKSPTSLYEWRRRISSYINEYCSESLQELELEHFYDSIFLEWKKPFKNVTKILFDFGDWNCEKTNMNLCEMFPSLRRLDFKSMTFSSSKCIDHHFPNLEHIQMPMYTSPSRRARVKTKMYEQIFDLNPHLRSIHIKHMDDFDVLRVASEKLINLETIELSNMEFRRRSTNNENIRFKSVKRIFLRLVYIQPQAETIFPLKFDQLEEIKIETDKPIENKWIEFTAQQHKLKYLTILGAQLNLQQWMTIIENAPQLESIKTRWLRRNDNEGIVELMATKTNLKKIIFGGLTEESFNILKNRIDPEWRVEGDVQRDKDVTFIPRENL